MKMRNVEAWITPSYFGPLWHACAPRLPAHPLGPPCVQDTNVPYRIVLTLLDEVFGLYDNQVGAEASIAFPCNPPL